MWETITIWVAVVIGVAAVIFIIRHQARGDAPGCCSGCPYGRDQSSCAPPPDADSVPDGCEKPK